MEPQFAFGEEAVTFGGSKNAAAFKDGGSEGGLGGAGPQYGGSGDLRATWSPLSSQVGPEPKRAACRRTRIAPCQGRAAGRAWSLTPLLPVSAPLRLGPQGFDKFPEAP